MPVIEGFGPVAPAPRPQKRAGGGGFAVSAEGSRAGDAQAAEASAAGELSLAGLLTLQAETAEDIHDRAARRRGRDILAELEGLRLALLKDGIDPGQLRRLANLTAERPVASDLGLRAVVDQIALRAMVELARHGMA